MKNLKKIPIYIILFFSISSLFAQQGVITKRIIYPLSYHENNSIIFQELFALYKDTNELKKCILYENHYYTPSSSFWNGSNNKIWTLQTDPNDVHSLINDNGYGIQFIEKWSIDSSDFSFIKKIESLNIITERIDPNTKEFRLR